MKHRTLPCPSCQKPTEWENNAFRPFCSRECKARDLGNWATERYRVPAEEAEAAEASASPPGQGAPPKRGGTDD